MKSMMNKSTLREIKSSFGRYFAILAIIALGVGFFAGLKVTKETMLLSTDEYIIKQQLFDYRLVSTLGFEQEDVDAIAEKKDVRAAKGHVSADMLYINDTGEGVIKAHTLSDEINKLTLMSGRMPKKADECVVDSALFDEKQIGEKIVLSSNNEEDDREIFTYGEYKITGIVQSSYYMNFERGNTSLGTGQINGFMYLLPEGFDCDYFTEIFVKFNTDYPIYSDDYNSYMDAKEAEWKEYCKEQGIRRYEALYEEGHTKLEDAKKELSDKEKEAQDKLRDAKAELEDGEEKVLDGERKLSNAKKKLDSNESQLKVSQRELDSQKEGLEAQKQAFLQMGLTVFPPEIAAAELQLEAAGQQLNEARNQIKKGRAEIADNEKELTDAKIEVEDGWKEYEESKADAEEKIADAKRELADAEEELEELEKPDTYVLGRDTNIGYACFESDSNIVDGVANVFPLFFFLVAALVCITTMNRMVEEQRTQIGVLKALGYGELSIMNKYMIYSGSAAILGCSLGFLGGTLLFPKVIFDAYRIMYSLPDLKYVFNPVLAIISIIVALICSIGTTWLSCRHELKEAAANLMRPKAPRAGRRVFLEYIPFIWKRLRFLHKVSVRNILRYKKRFFMMVIGISGCTALVVTGLGVKDSIANIGEKQFEEIQIYDLSVSFQKPQKPEENTAFTNTALEESVEHLFVAEKPMNFVANGKVKSGSLVAVSKAEEMKNYINLHEKKGAFIEVPKEDGAVITNKMADILQVSVGDVITIRDDDLKEASVKISAVSENFANNYVYISEKTYEDIWGTAPEYKTAYLNIDSEKDVHQLAAGFMKLSGVTTVTVNADVKARVSNMMSSLNYIVLLIIVCAAILAFIVLYNLTNINITERMREIATIKVLGFYRGETAAYVFRENLVLTAIGAAVGLLLGKMLHIYVMNQINIDLVSFDIQVKLDSYILSVILTFGFAMIVNIFMSFKLERINMAESLKSID